jgi:hypothetical protein
MMASIFTHPRIPNKAKRRGYSSGFTPELDAALVGTGPDWHSDARIANS